MAHKHSVYDTDPHFVIDPVTRAIRNASTSKTTLIQYDHNSERFTFEIPRYVDGHDMSDCDKVEIHYINTDSVTKEAFKGLYEVIDMQVSPDDEEFVIFSWLISQNATKYVGTLSFLIRFVCLTDEVIDYAWHTGIHAGISVSNGLYNSDIIVQDYVDLLEQWRQTAPEIDLDEDESGITINVSDREGTQSVFIERLKAPEVDLTEDESGITIAVTDGDGTHTAFIQKVQTNVKDADVFTEEIVTLNPGNWYASNGVYLYNAKQSTAASWANDIDACVITDIAMINEASRCQVFCTDRGVGGDTMLRFTAFKDVPTIPIQYRIRVWTNYKLSYEWDSESLTLTVEEH